MEQLLLDHQGSSAEQSRHRNTIMQLLTSRLICLLLATFLREMLAPIGASQAHLTNLFQEPRTKRLPSTLRISSFSTNIFVTVKRRLCIRAGGVAVGKLMAPFIDLFFPRN